MANRLTIEEYRERCHHPLFFSLLDKTEKGFYIKSSEGKIYFPDRNYPIKEVVKDGVNIVAVYAISIDKDKYGFFIGECITPQEFTYADYKAYRESLDIDTDSFLSVTKLNSEQDILMVTGSRGWSTFTDYIVKYNGECRKVSFFKYANFHCVTYFESLYLIEGFKSSSKELTIVDVITGISPYVEFKYAEAFDNRFAVIHESGSVKIIGYVGEKNRFANEIISTSNAEYIFRNHKCTATYSHDDVVKFMEENHIGFSIGSYYTSDGEYIEALGVEHASFGQSTMDVVSFYAGKLNEIFDNPDAKKIVEESWRDFDVFRKRCGKAATSRTIDQLANLSPKRILKLNRI